MGGMSDWKCKSTFIGDCLVNGFFQSFIGRRIAALELYASFAFILCSTLLLRYYSKFRCEREKVKALTSLNLTINNNTRNNPDVSCLVAKVKEPASEISSIENNIGAFDHYKVGDSMADYLNELDLYIDASNYKGSKVKLLWYQVGSKIRNAVKDVAVEGQTDQQRYESISEILRKEFAPASQAEDEALEQFDKIEQGDDTASQFLRKIRKAADISLHEASRELKQKLIRFRFLQGLRDSQMRVYLKKRGGSVDEMASHVDKLEKADLEEQQRNKMSSIKRLSRIDSLNANLSQEDSFERSNFQGMPESVELYYGRPTQAPRMTPRQNEQPQAQRQAPHNRYEIQNRQSQQQQQNKKPYQQYRNQSVQPGHRVGFVDEIDQKSIRSNSNHAPIRT